VVKTSLLCSATTIDSTFPSNWNNINVITKPYPSYTVIGVTHGLDYPTKEKEPSASHPSYSDKGKKKTIDVF